MSSGDGMACGPMYSLVTHCWFFSPSLGPGSPLPETGDVERVRNSRARFRWNFSHVLVPWAAAPGALLPPLHRAT